MAAAEVWGPSLTGSGEAEELHGLRASASLFEVLGVQAAAGRVFLPEDERPDAAPVVVIGAGLWKRRFGGDRGVIGRTITLNQASYTVAGVLPESFYFPPFWALDAEIYTPLVWPPAKAQSRDMSTLRAFGRLKPGVTWAQAAADMRTIARSLAREYPRSNAEKSAVVTPLHEMAVGNVRASLTILLGAVGCTLLIACANLANLFLARATGAAQGGGHPPGAGRGARRAGAAIDDGEPAGLLRRRRARPAGGMVGGGRFRRRPARGGQLPHAAPSGDRDGRPGDRVQLRGVPGHRTPLRPDAGAARLAHGPELVAEGSLARVHGGPLGTAHPRRAGGVGDRAGADAARRRGTAGAELPQSAAISTPGSTRTTWWRSACRSRDRNMRRPIAAPPSIAKWWRNCAPCPECSAASAVNHVPIAGDLFRLGVVIEGRPAPRPGDAPSAAYRVALPGYFQTIGMRLRARPRFRRARQRSPRRRWR